MSYPRKSRAVAAATTATAIWPYHFCGHIVHAKPPKKRFFSLVYVHVHDFSGRVLRVHMHGNNPGWREVCTSAQTRVVL